MNSRRARSAVAALAATLLMMSAVVALPVAATQRSVPAKVFTACVNKKSGAMRLLVKGKCKKSERKISWNGEGPMGPAGASGANGANGSNGLNGADGAQGPAGPSVPVRDKNGATVGTLVGMSFDDVFGWVVTILRGGGIYYVAPDGRFLQFFPDNAAVFTDAACTGTAYATASANGFTTARYEALVGGPIRFLTRSDAGVIAAYQLTSTHMSVSAQALYTWQSNGTCGQANPLDPTPYTGELFTLSSVPAPADAPGPLTFG